MSYIKSYTSYHVSHNFRFIRSTGQGSDGRSPGTSTPQVVHQFVNLTFWGLSCPGPKGGELRLPPFGRGSRVPGAGQIPQKEF